MAICCIHKTVKLSYQCFLISPIFLKEIARFKSPFTLACCSNYSGKKLSILKRKFVNSEQKILESKNVGSVIKKLNWENEKLFGQIIKTAQQRKKEIEMGMVNIGEETFRKQFESIGTKTVIASEGTPTHIIERGYKNIPPLDFLKPISKKSSPEKNEMKNFSPDSIDEKNLSESQDILLNSNETKEVALDYFSNYNAENKACFSTDTIMKPPFKGIAVQELLQFPLVNPWRSKNTTNSTGGKSIQDIPYDEANKTYKGYPSVTDILNKTMDPESAALLERWKKQMISKLGEEGFQIYQQDLFDNGKYFHESMMQYLQGTPVDQLEINPNNKGHWQSLQTFLPSVGDVHLLESKIIHSFLMYKGVIDCVARYRDHLVVIDWKTTKKQKPTLSATYDYPLQVAAYVGALNFDQCHKLMVDSALLVIAYEDGSPCHTHFLSTDMCEHYWKEWLKRLHQYWNVIDMKNC